MANHKATIKSAKQSRVRRARNRYDKKTTSNLIRKFNAETDVTKKLESLPKLFSHIDKLAKKNIIHDNKASNLKRKLDIHAKQSAEVATQPSKKDITQASQTNAEESKVKSSVKEQQTDSIDSSKSEASSQEPPTAKA